MKHKGYNNVVSSNGNSVAQKWGYNGRELNEELGLNWHDYGARNYDASLGRWMNIDPLADKYRDFTPYNYTANNPIQYVDPDGKRIEISNNTKDALFKLAQIAATNRGGKMLDRLISSKRNYTMEKVFWSSNSAYDSNGEIGKARTIYYPSSVWRYSIDGGDPGSTYVTGHELNHAYNDDRGFRLTRKQNESSSVRFGNYLRSVYGEEDMRTSYYGLGLSFSDNPKSYNRKGEGISDFKETLSVEAGGNTFLGVSYEKTEKGKTSTEYMVSLKTENGSFLYRKFTDKKEYDAAVKRIKAYQESQKKKEDEEE